MNTLFDVDDLPKTATLRDRFETFHARNPRVYEALEGMAAMMVARGRKRISIKMCVEVLRWNYYLQTTDPSSEYRLNNSYSAYYARLLLKNHPDWDGLFQLREVHESPAILVRRKAS